jgi:hypothetical protein
VAVGKFCEGSVRCLPEGRCYAVIVEREPMPLWLKLLLGTLLWLWW